MAHQVQPRGKRDGSSASDDAEGRPEAKRRRVEKPAPDDSGDWDDLQITQQDLENIDVMASQAIEAEASTSRQADTEQTLDVGSSLFIEAGQDQPSVFQAPAPGASVRLKLNRSSTSSSSDSSIYPQSSASLRKTPSSDISSAAGSLTSNKSSAGSSSHSSVELPGSAVRSVPSSSDQNGAAGNIVTITALREDVRKMNIEAQKAKSELYAKDGEVKYLKDSLRKQEQELEKLRAEREERKDAEEQRQKEREKELKQEVERLQSQVQFKDQDCLQLQQRCRTLESKLTHQQTSSPSEAQPSTSTGGVTLSQAVRSPDKSPKVRKVVSRTPEKRAFPSEQSFMSPRVAPRSSQSIGTMTAEERTVTVQPAGDRLGGRRQRFRLRVQFSGGKTTGPQLVSKLLQCSCTNNGDVEDSGIVGLLQTLPSRLDLMELKYERDGSTARLSPVRKPKRLSVSGTQTPKPPPTESLKPVVKREHFLLAMQGLRQLINSSTSKQQPASSKPEQTESRTSNGALLLLPMLNDYLQHYIDILSSRDAAPTSPNVSSSSNKSSSLEASSSLESLTSSLGLLLQQGAEYANSMETLVLCALRVLNTLVCACDEVCAVLVMSRVGSPLPHPATDTSSSYVETDQEKDKTSESGVEADDERSTTSSKGSSFLISPTDSLRSPAARQEGINLLHKIIRLASPSQESSGFKVPVVEAALDILISLAIRLPHADVERLQVIVLRGILTDCLQLEHQPGIVVRALDLFSSLVRSRSIVPFLCTKSDSCTLLSIHLVSTRLLARCRGKKHLQPLLMHIISKVMDIVSSVVAFHRNGVHVLTDNNCRCSGQIIPSLVHSMFYLLRDHQMSLSDHVFGLLRKGVLLLHEMSLRDPNYQQRHNTVQCYYTTLMSGLTRLYRQHEDLPQVEVTALEDLWEELDESDACSQGSQDSDHEDPIVIN